MAGEQLPDELLAGLPQALEIARARVCPATIEDLAAAATHALRIIGIGMSQEEKGEWIDAVIDEFSKAPGPLVIEALKLLPHKTHDPRKAFVEITNHIGDSPKILKWTLDTLEWIERRVHVTSENKPVQRLGGA